MLGRPVWPEDFFSEQSGYKVRMAWPLPDCSHNCPSTWIGDGCVRQKVKFNRSPNFLFPCSFCDKACNVSECFHDGGDCLGDDVKMGFGDQDADHAFHWNQGYDKPLCAEGCLDNWLADK